MRYVRYKFNNRSLIWFIYRTIFTVFSNTLSDKVNAGFLTLFFFLVFVNEYLVEMGKTQRTLALCQGRRVGSSPTFG